MRVQPGDAADIARETLLQGKILFPLLSVSPNRSYRADILFERETGMLAAIDEAGLGSSRMARPFVVSVPGHQLAQFHHAEFPA